MLGLKSPQRFIGLDVGQSSIRAAQVSVCESGPSLDGCVMLRRQSGGQLLSLKEAEQLLRVMERRGMTATNLVLVAPREALVGGSISVPPADKNVPRDKIVESELSRANKLSPGTFEMAWWDLPLRVSGSRIGQAHALALPHAAVESMLDLLSECGLQVIRTLPGSLALLAAAQRKPIDPRCIAAVLDLGSTRGHLSLMYAGRVVHERAIPDFDMQKLCQHAGDKLGVERELARDAVSRYGITDHPEGAVACEVASVLHEAIGPLAEEIGMSFAYVSHLYPEAELGQLLLTGHGANLSGLDEVLSAELELETAVIMPSGLLSGDTFGQECHDPSLTTALGAALCGEVSA